MLIDSELLKLKLNEIDEIYSKTGICSGIPSYVIFKGIIESVERSTLEGETK